jgi:hypothetical protein
VFCRFQHPTLRLLPAGATVAGWVIFLPLDQCALFTAHEKDGLARFFAGNHFKNFMPIRPMALKRWAKPAILITGFEQAGEIKPAISTAGNGVGRKSHCEPLAEVEAG